MRAWTSIRTGMAGLTLKETPPRRPGPHEALVEVRFAALNFSDLLMMEDRYQVRPERPFIPGQEVAGVVLELGPDCHLRLGQRVASKVEWGAFAERCVVRDDMALEVPDSMDLARAAALPVAYTTAVVALTESTSVAAGETVLIHGAAGGVGLAAVEVAAALGARVLATAGSPEKRTLAKEHGADEVIDYGRPDWHEEVDRLTGGAGVDVILDPVGGDVTLQSLRCAAWGGRLLIVGFASGTVPKLPAHRLLLKRISAIGVYWNHDRDKAMLERVSSRVMGLARTNAIRPHIDDRYGFDALPQALEALRARKVQGKAVLAVARGGDTS